MLPVRGDDGAAAAIAAFMAAVSSVSPVAGGPEISNVEKRARVRHGGSPL